VTKEKSTSELLAAAQGFRRGLASYARLADAACRAPLNSQKNLQRAAHVFEQISVAEKRLGDVAQTLVSQAVLGAQAAGGASGGNQGARSRDRAAHLGGDGSSAALRGDWGAGRRAQFVRASARVQTSERVE